LMTCADYYGLQAWGGRLLPRDTPATTQMTDITRPETDRQQQTYRQTDRQQTLKKTYRQTDRRQIYKETERQTDSKEGSKVDRQTIETHGDSQVVTVDRETTDTDRDWQEADTQGDNLRQPSSRHTGRQTHRAPVRLTRLTGLVPAAVVYTGVPTPCVLLHIYIALLCICRTFLPTVQP
jgi:hypothetical protein